MRSFFFITFSTLLAGCALPPSRFTEAPSSPPSVQKTYRWQHERIDETRAIIIAQDTIAKSGGSPDRMTYSAHPSGSGWSVIARRIVGYDESGKPQFVIGGHQVIRMNEHGTVTRYGHGM